MEELKEKLEGQNLDGTSPSEETPATENQIPDLNSTPVPTEQEIKDANFQGDEQSVSENQGLDGNITPSENPENPAPVVEEPTVAVDNPDNPSVAPVEEPQVHEENGVIEAPIKTFTQSQVDDIAGKTRLETREKTFRYIYDRYGVKSESELDDLVGNAQRYDTLKEQYDGEKKAWNDADAARNNELAEVKERVALMESGIDKERYDDAKLILKGKGLEITTENILNELNTHPEWKNEKKIELPPVPQEPKSEISVLGNESGESKEEELSEEDFAMKKLFKL